MGLTTRSLTTWGAGALRVKTEPDAVAQRIDTLFQRWKYLDEFFGVVADGEDTGGAGGSFSGTDIRAAFQIAVFYCRDHGIEVLRIKPGKYRFGDPLAQTWVDFAQVNRLKIVADDPEATVFLMDEDYDFRIAVNRGGCFFFNSGNAQGPDYFRNTLDYIHFEGITFQGRWTHWPGGDGGDPNHVGPSPIKMEGYSRVVIRDCQFYDVRNKATRCAHNDSFLITGCRGARLARGFVRSVDTNGGICSGNHIRNADDDVVDFNITADIALNPPIGILVFGNVFEDCESALCSQGRGVHFFGNKYIRSKGASVGVTRAGGNQPTSGKVAHWGAMITGENISDNLERYSFDTPLTGTVTVTATSDQLVGTGTLFLTELTVGDHVTTAGLQERIVESIEDNTHATMTVAYATTETNVAADKDSFAQDDEDDAGNLLATSGTRGCISISGNRPSAATVLSANLTGTITVEAGEFTVTGSGAAFLTELVVGMAIRTAGGQEKVIHTITDNNTATTLAAFTADETGVTYKRGAAPGKYNPFTGRFTLPWDTDASTPNAGYMHGHNTGSYSIPPGIGYLVADNVITRTLPEVTNYSDWGFGEMFTRRGWRDPEVVNDNFRPNGVQLVFDLENVVVANNNVSHMTGAAIVLDGNNSDYGKRCFQNILITGNLARAVNNYVRMIGPLEEGTGTPIVSYWSVRIEGGKADIDPYCLLANRTNPQNNPDGTWVSTLVNVRTGTAIWVPGIKGVSIANVEIENCYRPVGDGVNASPQGIDVFNVLLRCDPTATGYHASNRGIGNCPVAGEAYRYMIVNSNPEAAGGIYQSLINECPLQADAIPTTGKRVAGEEVRIHPPITSGGRTLTRVRRMTTGTGHVTGGIDWLEQYDGQLADLSVTTGKIAANAVTDAKLRQSAALSVIGRSANSTGDPADIAAGSDGEVLRRSGTTLGFGTVATAGIADDAVTDAKLRESAALSVIGRSANSGGNPADIAAASDNQVLRRSGTAIGFGTVATDGIADDAVTDAKLRESSALSVIGRSANSTGNPADIAAASDGEVLRRSGTALGFGKVATAGISDDAVTNALLANMAESTIKGRGAGAGTGDPTDLTQAQARAAAGVDKRTAFGDEDATIAATDRLIVTSAALTAQRGWSLPLANTVNAGHAIEFIDEAGACNDYFPLFITRSGSDLINGALSFAIRKPFARATFYSDGVSKWTTDAGYGSRPNFLRNSAFDVWQRGTSFTTGGRGPDLWQMSTTAGRTYSRQAGFNGARYCFRVQRDNGNATTTQIRTVSILSVTDSIALAGRTVRLSADVRCGANYSEASSELVGRIYTGTGVEEAFSLGSNSFVTGSKAAITQSQVISTTAKRITWQSAVLDTDVTEVAVWFAFTPAGTAGAADYFEITNIKIEVGSNITPYQADPFSVTLEACKRRFERIGGDIADSHLGKGFANSTTHAFANLNYTEKRAIPTITVTGGGTDFEVQRTGAVVATTALAATASNIGLKACQLDATVASGLTAGEAIGIKAKATTGVIDVSADI